MANLPLKEDTLESTVPVIQLLCSTALSLIPFGGPTDTGDWPGMGTADNYTYPQADVGIPVQK